MTRTQEARINLVARTRKVILRSPDARPFLEGERLHLSELLQLIEEDLRAYYDREHAFGRERERAGGVA